MTYPISIDNLRAEDSYLQYMCRRQRPANLLLLLGSIGLLALTMVFGAIAEPSNTPLWIRVLPLVGMAALTVTVWLTTNDDVFQVATLGNAMMFLAGLLLDNAARRNGIIFASPALIIVGVASSMIWVRAMLFLIEEVMNVSAMVAVLTWGDVPSWLLTHLAIYMALSIVIGGFLYLVTFRLSYNNFILEQALRRGAYLDDLTGLANRRRILQVARRMFERYRAEKHPFSVLYIDVDRFKEINDTFGHEQGDKVLRHLAGVIEGAVRPTDLVGRLGGEEFMVVAPVASHGEAIEIAERVRKAVAASSLGNLAVTVSIGVATSRRQHDFRMMLNAADANVLLAKRKGRNRIEASLQYQVDMHETHSIQGVRARAKYPV